MIFASRKRGCWCSYYLPSVNDSREAVDAFFDKAIAAWGKATIPAYDHGFMYGKDFEDLDGHIWEAFVMDVSQMPSE
jgi:predicted lactoylglutathione lyase